MITNEVQYHATKAHLDCFDAASVNLEAKLAQDPRSRLAQLELDAVRARRVICVPRWPRRTTSVLLGLTVIERAELRGPDAA